MKQCSKSENVLIIDSDYEEADGFIKGVREVTGEEWQVALHENNKIYGWRRYVRFFTVALQTVLSGKKYEGKTVLCWQQFYGIAIAFFQRMFHMKKRYKLVIMTFIYKEKRGLAGKLFYRFVRYAVTSRYVDKIILTTQSEKPMYQEIFGVEDDLFDFARCGAIAYEPEIYDDEQLREKNYIFSTGRSNRDYGFLIDCIQNTSYAFSGMTEAFYRQLPVILITLGNSLDYTMELKDVVLGHYLVKDAKEILNFANYKLPAHIELGEEIIIDTEVESLKLQEALMEAVSEKDYLYFSPRFQTKEKDFMCKCISGGMSRCKDGTLSNVLGASLAQKRRRYIGVVTEEEFLHDMNTLGNIHANKDLFFIVISQKFEKMIGDYARTLNYEVICEAEDNICGTSLKRLFENGKQTIFIMLKK